MSSVEPKVPLHALVQHAGRTSLHAAIEDGSLPQVQDLLAGSPWFAGDLKQDMRVWCDSFLLAQPVIDVLQQSLDGVEAGTDISAIIQNMRDVGTVGAIKIVEHVMERLGQPDHIRLLCYRACLGDALAKSALVSLSSRSGWDRNGYDKMFETATVLGLIYQSHDSMHDYCQAGLSIIRSDSNVLSQYQSAAEHVRDNPATKPGERRSMDDIIAETGDDDTTGILPPPLDDDEIEEPSLVVVPKLPEGGSSHRRDIQKSWKGIDGRPLPIVTRGDIAAHRRALVAYWPHATDVIDVILNDLAAVEEVYFEPTILVGSPGSGKSSLVRAICDRIGLPVELYSVPGAADGSMAGTSAQWSTSREAVPLQLIKRSGMASVAMIWDEIEKAPEGRHNGNAWDSILPLLEPDQAMHFRDLALEVECDLSMVSHFATANTVTEIPAPLRDRMRVLRVPDPSWQHLSTITQQIIQRIEKKRKLHPGWHQPLAQDECEVIRPFWESGSIRKLTKIVRATLATRDRHMARC